MTNQTDLYLLNEERKQLLADEIGILNQMDLVGYDWKKYLLSTKNRLSAISEIVDSLTAEETAELEIIIAEGKIEDEISEKAFEKKMELRKEFVSSELPCPASWVINHPVEEEEEEEEEDPTNEEKENAFNIGLRDGFNRFDKSGFKLSHESLRNAYLAGHDLGVENYNYEDPNMGYHPLA